jgi:hypothetical protein
MGFAAIQQNARSAFARRPGASFDFPHCLALEDAHTSGWTLVVPEAANHVVLAHEISVPIAP